MTGVNNINNREYNKERNLSNLKFDNKLKKHGLIDFVRKSDYIDGNTEIKLFHIKCTQSFYVKPNNFFKRKHKCLHCHKKETKGIIKSKPKNSFYQEKINLITNNEFILVSDYYNSKSYIKLKHLKCNNIFESRADNFEKSKNKCPYCSDRDNTFNKSISEKIHDIEKILDFEYEILNKVVYSDGKVKLRHKACGKEFECSMSSITKFKNKKMIRIKCPKCYLEDRTEDFFDKLDRLYRGEFKLRGGCKGMHTPTKFYHKKCDSLFEVPPYYLLKDKVSECSKCKEISKKADFEKRLNDVYEDEFKLINYISGDKKVTLEHRKCVNVFDIHPSNLFHGSFPCKECLKKEKNKNKKIKYEEKINKLYNGKFSFVGEYLGIKTKTEFKCNSCDNTFYETPDIITQGRRTCHCCR